jgi:hypothetical protein
MNMKKISILFKTEILEALKFNYCLIIHTIAIVSTVTAAAAFYALLQH